MINQKQRLEITRCLSDAGCSNTVIQDYISCVESRDTGNQLKLLEKHRASLLERVHADEKCINCTDYFIYQIRKTDGTD
jgi:DNA-binding transcriptional MerR regulator